MCSELLERVFVSIGSQVVKSVVAWMMYFWPACPSSQKSNVFVALIPPARNCGGCTVPGGTTKRVILCGGKEVEIELPESGTLLKCVITFAEVSCHTWAL